MLSAKKKTIFLVETFSLIVMSIELAIVRHAVAGLFFFLNVKVKSVSIKPLWKRYIIQHSRLDRESFSLVIKYHQTLELYIIGSLFFPRRNYFDCLIHKEVWVFTLWCPAGPHYWEADSAIRVTVTVGGVFNSNATKESSSLKLFCVTFARLRYFFCRSQRLSDSGEFVVGISPIQSE